MLSMRGVAEGLGWGEGGWEPSPETAESGKWGRVWGVVTVPKGGSRKCLLPKDRGDAAGCPQWDTPLPPHHGWRAAPSEARDGFILRDCEAWGPGVSEVAWADGCAWGLTAGAQRNSCTCWGKMPMTFWSTISAQWKAWPVGSQALPSPRWWGSSLPIRTCPTAETAARGCWTLVGSSCTSCRDVRSHQGSGTHFPPRVVPVSTLLTLFLCSSQSSAGLLGFCFLSWGKNMFVFSFHLPNAPDPCSVGQNLTLQIQFLFHSLALFSFLFLWNPPSYRLVWGSCPTAFLPLKITN